MRDFVAMMITSVLDDVLFSMNKTPILYFLFPPGQSDTGAEKHTHGADDKAAL